jgi:hypothetical protein
MIIDSNKFKDIEYEYLFQLKVDAFIWRTLYNCKYCNIFLEERYTEDRLDRVPQLIKVGSLIFNVALMK